MYLPLNYHLREREKNCWCCESMVVFFYKHNTTTFLKMTDKANKGSRKGLLGEPKGQGPTKTCKVLSTYLLI